MMDQAEVNRLCNQPGAEGALWRLIRMWDPDKLAAWAITEKKRGLTPDQAVAAAAEVMSGAAFALAHLLGGDKHGAMLGPMGLVAQLKLQIEHKLNSVGGQITINTGRPNGKIILPRG